MVFYDNRAGTNFTEEDLPKEAPKRKRRPARQQVKPGQIEKHAPQQTGQTYNIWYHKWAGGDKFDEYHVKEKSKTRCVIADDAGYTRGDGAGNKYCCLFFARGCCPLGSECNYLHRLPRPDVDLPDTSLDTFGREKHADYRDDMGGVGSFQRQNRTLYIGRIVQTRDMEAVVEKHFDEWGEIERIRLLPARGVAFVTYKREHSAQFAKEAMMCQSLDNDEVVNVRWATTDPNKEAQAIEKARISKLGEEGIGKNLPAHLVRAIREMDELEGIVGAREEAFSDDEEQVADAQEAIEPAAKRARIAAPPVVKTGLLGAIDVAGLQKASVLGKNVPARTALGGLGGYASDSD